MNVLGISGSHRLSSNSHILLTRALAPFADADWGVTLVRMRDLTVAPCQGCGYCRSHGNRCKIDDDMGVLYGAFRCCDALIVSGPAYARNVCSQVVAVFDRYYAIDPEGPLEGKAGGAIAVGAGGGGGQATTISAIYTWMLSCGMVAVPGELNGVTAVARDEGEVLGQEKRLQQARVLGANVLKTAQKLMRQ